jgi:adenylate cyclase
MSSQQSQGLALLFTSIEGSARLSSRLGTLYDSVLKKHHEIIQSLLLAYQSQVIELNGDTSFITFENPEQALRAAIAFQQFISHHKWPNQEPVRIRLGLHWGHVPSAESHISDDVKLTLGICSVAHGEQILLSQAMAEKLKGKQINDLKIHAIGDFLLKDFADSITLFQLDVPGLKVNFPLLKTVSASPSIAVLPFHNLNNDSRDDYLGLGIAEEIIDSLGKNPGIQVLARANTFGVNPMLKIKDLGKVLNASVVLDGTVRKEDEKIYINVELTDINSGRDIWVKKYAGDESELMAIQDEIATSVTATLVTKDVKVRASDIQNIQTENIEAYDAYLKGNKFYFQYSLQSIQFARQMYQHALQLDRTYALAYCGLANCFSYLFMHHNRSEENLLNAEKFSKKAIALNSSLAAAYSAYGMALSLRENYEESEKAFEQAVSLEPMLFEAQYQYGRMEFNRGDLMKAAAQFEAASRIHQDDYQTLLLNGQCYDSLGNVEKGIETRVKGVQIAEEVLQLNPGDVRALYMGANGLVALGGHDNRKKGLEWLQRALILEPKDPMLLYNAGCIYSLCEMTEEALNCLERAIETGLTQKAWYEHDSNWDFIRNNPRFQKLLDSLSG